MRKGGIREPTFTPKATRFLLFPTAFHTDAQLLKPGVAEQFQQVGPSSCVGKYALRACKQGSKQGQECFPLCVFQGGWRC